MYKITVDYSPSETDNDIVREGLIATYASIVGERDRPFSIFLKNASEKVFGGIQAFLDKESVYIEILWVDKDLRNQGYGKKLLHAAEQEGIKNGCAFATLDTYDFEAEGFYLDNGYEHLGEIKNYWSGHSRIFLRKKLR